jgi:hypothetical protein
MKRIFKVRRISVANKHIAKILEIGEALRSHGICTIDAQAEALGLKRSTAWTIIVGTHKGCGGLSAATVNRMLQSPLLPAPVREVILQYVAEKISGAYGHNRQRRRCFAKLVVCEPALGQERTPRHQVLSTPQEDRAQPESR